MLAQQEKRRFGEGLAQVRVLQTRRNFKEERDRCNAAATRRSREL
jgi:hypothetical protein